MSEEKPRDGFVFAGEGAFQVSRDGRCLRYLRGEWVEALPNDQGTVQTYVPDVVGQKPFSRSLPKMVAQAFLPPVEGRQFAVCKNGDRTDCRVDNLEWRGRNELDFFFDNYQNDRSCRVCGTPISDWNKSGLCAKCQKKDARARNAPPYQRPHAPVENMPDGWRRDLCEKWNAGVKATALAESYDMSLSNVYAVVRSARKLFGEI